MKLSSLLLIGGLLFTGLMGCALTPKERAEVAKATLHEQKGEMVKDFRDCLKQHHPKGDAEACDAYKSAIGSF